MSTKKISIRPAYSPEDAAEVLHLIERLADFEHLIPPDDEARRRFIVDGFERQPPRFRALLAALEGEPACAYAIFFETYSTFLCMPTLYLEDIFVLPERREHGVGTAVMKYLVEEALRRGCGRMEWACLDWNTNAQRFYDRIGAKHMPEWFAYRLDRAGLEQLAGG